jgi:hypothetical protein
MTPEERAAGHVGFARAPGGWNWCAQERSGSWYWFRRRPVADRSAGEWIATLNDTQYAGESEPNPAWESTLKQRLPTEAGGS